MTTLRNSSNDRLAPIARYVATLFCWATKGGKALMAVFPTFERSGGGRRSIVKFRLLILAMSLGLFACGSGGGESASTPTLPDADVVESSSSTSTTAAPTTSTTSTSTSTTTTTVVESAGSVDEAALVWTSAWQTATDASTTAGDVEAFASADVAEGLKGLLGTADRAITNYPAVSEANDDGVFVVHDCLYSSLPLIGGNTAWYSAEVGADEDGELRVLSLSLESSDACVPAEVSDAAVAGYLEADDAFNELLSEVTISFDRIRATHTGAREVFLEGLRQEFMTDELELRGFEGTQHHPAVSAYNSPTDIELVDCQFLDPEWGVYSTVTGDRTDMLPALVPDQRNGVSTVLEQIDGTWRIASLATAQAFDCDENNKGLPIPVIGVGGDQLDVGETS